MKPYLSRQRKGVAGTFQPTIGTIGGWPIRARTRNPFVLYSSPICNVPINGSKGIRTPFFGGVCPFLLIPLPSMPSPALARPRLGLLVGILPEMVWLHERPSDERHPRRLHTGERQQHNIRRTDDLRPNHLQIDHIDPHLPL